MNFPLVETGSAGIVEGTRSGEEQRRLWGEDKGANLCKVYVNGAIE